MTRPVVIVVVDGGIAEARVTRGDADVHVVDLDLYWRYRNGHEISPDEALDNLEVATIAGDDALFREVLRATKMLIGSGPETSPFDAEDTERIRAALRVAQAKRGV